MMRNHPLRKNLKKCREKKERVLRHHLHLKLLPKFHQNQRNPTLQKVDRTILKSLLSKSCPPQNEFFSMKRISLKRKRLPQNLNPPLIQVLPRRLLYRQERGRKKAVTKRKNQNEANRRRRIVAMKKKRKNQNEAVMKNQNEASLVRMRALMKRRKKNQNKARLKAS